jgi:chorismate synthase
MAGNSFGSVFVLTTFGEIDGCPAGISLDFEFIASEMARRKPGQSAITTARKETDEVEFLSGIFEGKTLGTPIGFIIRNKDAQSQDYSDLKAIYRPSHADYTYEQKYGVRDYRGGGRSSARETACRVVAGAIAKLILKQHNISIHAFVKQVGAVKLEIPFDQLDLTQIDSNVIRCPHPATAERMIALIENIKAEGDTIGGIIQCVIQTTIVGLGEPVFDKLHAQLGKAMLSINAVKGFEIGSGFDSVNFKGSELNDVFEKQDEHIVTKTNNSGGIQGGISNGMPIYFNVAFKPVATIMKAQESIDTDGATTTLNPKGRHDPCVLPRAVPIVESMAALVMVDFLLRK